MILCRERHFSRASWCGRAGLASRHCLRPTGHLINRIYTWLWLAPAVGLAATMAPTATAQIIDENSQTYRLAPRTDTQVEIFTDVQHASNALAISNLPGGLELAPVSDTIWVKGISGSIAHALGRKVTAFAGANILHANFFNYDALNFFGVSAATGLELRPSRGIGVVVVGTCVSERSESGFKQYYGYCGPAANLALTGGRRTGTHVELSLGARMALGDRRTYARFNEASASLRFETGGRLRFSIEPRALVRRYSDLGAGSLDGKRIDYRAAVGVGLRHVSRRFELGLSAHPTVNWSNQAQFRFWDVRGGPSFKIRF